MVPLPSTSILTNIFCIMSISAALRLPAINCSARFLNLFICANSCIDARTLATSGAVDATPCFFTHRCCSSSSASGRLMTSMHIIICTTSFASSEMSGHGEWVRSYTPRSVARSSSRSVFPKNGGRPESKMYRITPSDQMSDLWLYSPRKISGATYTGVPTCSVHRSPGFAKHESPKSVALSSASSPGPSSRKFSGLRSRWMMPFLWHADTTVSIVRIKAAASASE
mmetsp:Transcript_12961/g.34923  ORF Transcript_12961/g.34923 Transcript_12961/m.34923 type:complete len:226 (-) Transcript_12961:378-1055(-)